MSNLSHEKVAPTLEAALSQIRQKVIQRGDLPHATVARQLEILEQLSQFELGRFLIQHRCGLNGYWTHYIAFSPKNCTALMEKFLLERSPLCKALQERVNHFQSAIQSELKEGGSYASIPCGLMGDFLLLDYSHLRQFTLMGIDLDPESIAAAQQLAEEKGLASHAQFETSEAWGWKQKEKYDLISSNGLNFYEPKDERVIELYRIFHGALKPNGLLVTSFLTPPPNLVHRCEWKLDRISMEDILIQKIIFVDLLEARWQSFRSTDQTRSQLQQAGFQQIEIIPDTAGMFPTVLARKSNL